MKKGIHPKVNNVLTLLTNGSSLSSTGLFSKDLLKLDIDTKSHNIWSGKLGFQALEAAGQLAKFKERFKSLSKED